MVKNAVKDLDVLMSKVTHPYFLGNRMQNKDRMASMKIICEKRSFATTRPRRGSLKQQQQQHPPHHHTNGVFITATTVSRLPCKASVTFILFCLYLTSCCWIQPLVASSSQKVSKTKLYITR